MVLSARNMGCFFTAISLHHLSCHWFIDLGVICKVTSKSKWRISCFFIDDDRDKGVTEQAFFTTFLSVVIIIPRLNVAENVPCPKDWCSLSFYTLLYIVCFSNRKATCKKTPCNRFDGSDLQGSSC